MWFGSSTNSVRTSKPQGEISLWTWILIKFLIAHFRIFRLKITSSSGHAFTACIRAFCCNDVDLPCEFCKHRLIVQLIVTMGNEVGDVRHVQFFNLFQAFTYIRITNRGIQFRAGLETMATKIGHQEIRKISFRSTLHNFVCGAECRLMEESVCESKATVALSCWTWTHPFV